MAGLATNTTRHTWLTCDFLENILKSINENSENIKVIDFMVHDAVPKGENYGSYLMRVTINYSDENESKETSLVIKTLLESEELNQMLEKSGVFEKEIAFYRDIVPKFKDYLNIIDTNFLCAPKCYAANINPTYIVFEDLKQQNYRNMDRGLGLDFNAIAMLFRKLAKLHAINAIIYETHPELFAPHKLPLLNSDSAELIKIFENSITEAQQVCLKWPGFEHLHDKLGYMAQNTLKIWESMYSVDHSTFNTLLHGDLWANNIMYQFDESNNPIDVRMVDFQCGIYGSPGFDLCYVLYTSSSNETLEEDWDRLLQIYHTELVKALKLLGYANERIPSLTELQIQILLKSVIGVYLAFAAVPARNFDQKIEADLNTMISDETKHLRTVLFEKPTVSKRLQYLLDFFSRKGILDYKVA